MCMLKKRKQRKKPPRFCYVLPTCIIEIMILLLFLIALRNIICEAENICVMCAGPANLTLFIGLSFFLCSNFPIEKYLSICP